jgi:anaphase-promoting complex subunit 6
MCYARGKAYLLIKDIDNARDCFKEALTVDVKCYDALEALVKYNMMEEKAGKSNSNLPQAELGITRI